jgi:thioredoxin reductase (NADPH)
MTDCDVLVVGAGPAGLTAAIYLARYRRRVVVAHDGESRALRIPLTYNAPGFPAGIVGAELVGRMLAQAELYGATVVEDHIGDLDEADGGWVATGGAGGYRARAVILATGIRLHEADLPPALHESALAWGCLRYCPVCDGYEAHGRAVAVLGSSLHGAREALFLREFTPDVTLLAHREGKLDALTRAALAAAKVRLVETPVARLAPSPAGMGVELRDETSLEFDVLYPALGCSPRSELIAGLCGDLDETGRAVTSPHQALDRPRLYAAGDLVTGLNQITVAIGQGAVAATAAHNALRELDGHDLSGLSPPR